MVTHRTTHRFYHDREFKLSKINRISKDMRKSVRIEIKMNEKWHEAIVHGIEIEAFKSLNKYNNYKKKSNNKIRLS